MRPWWQNKIYWIKTLSGGCCSTLELMGKKESDGEWTYAIVQTKDGQKTAKAIFKGGKDITHV